MSNIAHDRVAMSTRQAVVESSTARAARTEEYCKAEDGTSAKPPTGPFLPPVAHMVPREI